MGESEVFEYLKRHEQAITSLENRALMLEQVFESIEYGFTLVGSTAIEDRLQDGVPETITFMREAGMKVWMLTGDKIETAVTIGHSSGLLDEKGMRHHHLIGGT